MFYTKNTHIYLLKKITSFLLLFSIFLWQSFFFIDLAFAANPVVNTNISVEKTGSEPFDANTWDGSTLSTAWFDSSEDNNVTRLQDSITYRVEVSVNDSDAEELISTVLLDKHQAWIELPTGCLTTDTDPSVTTNASYISTDRRTLTCNLWAGIEGTTRIFFPTARAIWASYDGTVVTLNDQHVGATVSSQADGVSNIATDGPTDVVVTADFRVNTTKDLKVPDADIDDDGDLEIIYDAIAKDGPNGEDGMLMEYVIKSTYTKGSMIADSDEVTFEVDYDLFDWFTDNNDNNNTSWTGWDLSSWAKLYTWDSTIPACQLVGDHWTNATVNCTQNDIPWDFTWPALVPDGINDPNIDIDLDNIDVRDPDNDGNLLEIAVNIWVPRTLDIDWHQSCSSWTCENFVINSAGSYDGTTIQGFNPTSTEDVWGNNLLNYNWSGEPTFADQTRDFLLIANNTWGGIATYKGFENISTRTRLREQYVASGQIIPNALYALWIRANLFSSSRSLRMCDKIDTTVYEFVKPSITMAQIIRQFYMLRNLICLQQLQFFQLRNQQIILMLWGMMIATTMWMEIE